MGWTEPLPLSESDRLAEELNNLPMRDHAVMVVTMTLLEAFRVASKIEPDHFKDLCFAGGRAIKHVATCDVLKFLMEHLTEHLEKAPESVTVEDILLLLAAMGRQVQRQAEAALRDAERLVRLLPSTEATNARK